MDNKYNALDITKLIMSIMVISIHAAPLVEYEGLLGYIINQGVARVAVPFFFIVSGFFLYAKISLNKIKAWAIKTFKVYALWTFFYLFVLVIYFSFISKSGGAYLSINNLIPNLLFGYSHLWFLPALIVGGVMLWMVSDLSNINLILLSIIIYFSSCLLWYGFFYGNEKIINLVVNTGYLRNGVFFGFPFMCIGYLIAKNESLIKKSGRLAIALLTATSILMLILESYYNLNHNRILSDFLFLLPFSSAMIFIASIFYLKINTRLNFGIVSKDVYYIHIVLLMFYSRFFDGFSLITITLLTSIAYSFALSYSKKTLIKFINNHR